MPDIHKVVEALKLAAGAIKEELDAAGGDDHPVLQDHAKILETCRKTIAAYEEQVRMLNMIADAQQNLPGPRCHIHTDTVLVCSRCTGARGGQGLSKEKLAAIRKNAALARQARVKIRKEKLARERGEKA